MYREYFAKWESFDVFNIREAGQVLRVFGAEKDENGEYRKPALGQSIAHSRISTVVLRYKFFDIVAWLTGKLEPVSDAYKVFPNANALLECKTTRFSMVGVWQLLLIPFTDFAILPGLGFARKIERLAH